MERFLIAALGAVAVILALILAEHYRHRTRGGDGLPRPGRGRTVLLACLGVAFIAASAAAAFSVLQWRAAEAERRSLETQRSDLEAQKSGLEARLEQLAERRRRARVFATASLSGAMIIKGGEISLAAHYQLENRGDAAARETRIAAAIIPQAELNVAVAQEALCRRLSARPNAATAGQILPPQQRLSLSRIEAGGPAGRRFIPIGGAGIKFWWVGCVEYESAGDNARHRSGFVYQIAEAGAASHRLVPIALNDQIIPKDRLVIIPYRGGGFLAD